MSVTTSSTETEPQLPSLTDSCCGTGWPQTDSGSHPTARHFTQVFFLFIFTLKSQHGVHVGQRRHYLNELGMLKARENRKEKEELSEIFPTCFLEEIRQRNRLDRLRRLCREEISSDCEVSRLLESGPSSSLLDPIPVNILAEDADPLPQGKHFRIDSPVSKSFSICHRFH